MCGSESGQVTAAGPGRNKDRTPAGTWLTRLSCRPHLRTPDGYINTLPVAHHRLCAGPARTECNALVPGDALQTPGHSDAGTSCRYPGPQRAAQRRVPRKESVPAGHLTRACAGPGCLERHK